MSKIHIGSMASVVDEQNVLWMSNIFFNGLFRMDLERQDICCVGAFEGVNISAEDLHRGAHISGNEIVFTPFYDQAVRIYHVDSNTYQTIAIPKEHKPPFSESTRIGQNIFFLSKDGRIWNYDIDKHSLTIDELSRDYKKFLDIAEGLVSTTVDSEGFLLLKAGDTLLYRINLVKRETKMMNVAGNLTNLGAAFYGEGMYWFFLNNSQNVVSWDREKAEFTVYTCGEERWAKNWGQGSSTYMPYSRMIFANDTVWIPNYNALRPVWIDKNKKSLEAIVEDIEGFHVIDTNIWGPVYSNLHIVGQDIWFIPCYANLALCYNHETGTVRAIELAVAQEKIPYFGEIVKDKWKGKVIREREELYTLEELIKSIKCDGNGHTNMAGNDVRDSGRTIWKNIMKI